MCVCVCVYVYVCVRVRVCVCLCVQERSAESRGESYVPMVIADSAVLVKVMAHLLADIQPGRFQCTIAEPHGHSYDKR